MSYFQASDPQCDTQRCGQSIAVEIIPRSVDLGGFNVLRALPSLSKRTVGAFVFFDQMGPGEFLTGKGLDVRPHPHIGLSTLTYLFEGRIQHRDTLGNNQIIVAGDVNLMTAGRGIAHSERTPKADRLKPQRFLGIQCWLALPLDKEEVDPSFTHYETAVLPSHSDKSMSWRVAAGNWMGLKSPVYTLNDAVFVEMKMKSASETNIPKDIEERAIHVVSGEIEIDSVHYKDVRMLVLKPGADVKVRANADTHLLIVGGSALEKPRHVWWNFVARSRERIEQAKVDWTSGKFGTIPGDEEEFIPLPS